jgi:hypothetical protein
MKFEGEQPGGKKESSTSSDLLKVSRVQGMTCTMMSNKALKIDNRLEWPGLPW